MAAWRSALLPTRIGAESSLPPRRLRMPHRPRPKRYRRMVRFAVAIAAFGALGACTALCGGEAPEGPGWVSDAEHIPGTNIIAPTPVAQIEQGYEWVMYPYCEQRWVRLQ